MNVISFSLFGDNPLYTSGALQNAELCPVIYPGWKPVFYAGSDVPREIIAGLSERHATVVPVDCYGDRRKDLARAPYWRFMANDLADLDYCIFRDCDSRIGHKEKAAVDAWIESGKAFHFIYDHPWHTTEILAGMWGVRGDTIPRITALIDQFFPAELAEESYKPYTDQAFLQKVIWKQFVTPDNYLAHSTPENSAWHRQRGITITPFPAADGFFDPARQSYIGQTIPVPRARRKQKAY